MQASRTRLAAQAFRCDLRRDAVGVYCRSRDFDGSLTGVCAEDLDGGVEPMLGKIFEDDDGERVGLFARGTAGAPDADRFVLRTILQQGGKDILLQGIP